MTQGWDRLTGVTIAGKYLLDKWLGGEEKDAFFLTQFGPDGARAVLKLVLEDPAAAAAQLAAWRRTAQLSHPNLLGLFDCGRAGLVAKSADASYLYAVFEYPDDNLALALERGALTEAETLETLRAALDGLRYLHGKGMVHGAVDPAHIVAVGDRIKLASDTLREPGGGYAPADDVRALGNLLQALMGMPEPGAISEPLNSIIRHATDENASRRWTLEEIAKFLDPPGSTLIQEEKPTQARMPVPRWAYAVGTVLVLMGVMFALMHRSGPEKAEAPAHAAPPPASRPAIPPERPAPMRAAAATTTRERAEPGRIWRVIAYTYSGFKAADHKARRINAKHPSFHAEVFAPRGRNRAPYMVALGGRMTRVEAVRLQHLARSRGLARDTFIRNFAE